MDVCVWPDDVCVLPPFRLEVPSIQRRTGLSDCQLLSLLSGQNLLSCRLSVSLFLSVSVGIVVGPFL